MKLLNTSLQRKSLGKSESGLGLKVMAATLALSLLTAPLLSSIPNSYAVATAATEPAPTIKLVEEVPVTAGAKLQKYVWSSTRSDVAVSTNANVLVIDLNNPNVKLDVMNGVDGQFTKRQSIKGMAQDTEAVAGVNGDYYGVAAEGVPIGPQITNGELVSSPSYLTGMYAFALTKDNKPLIDTFTFTGSITAANGQSYALAGINKTYYFTSEGTHSHANSLYIYTSAWGSTSRANDGYTTPTEVLVVNDTITQISEKVALNMVPPADGYILRATQKAAEYVMKNMKVGDRITASYKLVPSDSTKTYDTSNFKMMIGGHTILVNEGKTTAFSRDVSSLGGYRSRTGLGYSKDGRYVYMITVDKKDDSMGMSLKEFQSFMISIGVWKGLNLDGGGSTQMVSRPLGDTDAVVVSALENGTARQVVNGLGVYTLAPEGQLAGILIQGQNTLFLNEKSTFALKAYDTYYNPITTGVQNAKWTATNGTGSGIFESGVFTATGAGTATITARADGGIKQTKEIDIIGRRQINSMAFDSSNFILAAGESYELPIIVATVKGVKRTIPSELLSWEFNGFEGTVTGNVVHVTKIGSNGIARIIARYDGFSTMLTRSAGVDKLFADFDTMTYELQKQVTPDSVLGNVQLTSGLVVGEPNNKSLVFEYNFEAGTGTKAVYASFGVSGAAVEGKPARMTVDVMGDATLNWLRAEFVDANNKSHMVDIANPVDWFGWKSMNVDLEPYKMVYPIKLKRVYVVNPELGQDEREPIGYLAVDNIKFQYEGELPVLPNAQVQMAIDRSTLTVNGEQMKLDQAPILVNGTTMIPVRFFVDAMGGLIQWDAKSQRATIIRDHHLIEMWIKDEEVIVDGKRVVSLEAPRLMKGRTMLPLRLISEALGWKVGWDQTTKSITLE